MCVVIKESTEDKALILLSWTGPFQGNERLVKSLHSLCFYSSLTLPLVFPVDGMGKGRRERGIERHSSKLAVGIF